MPKGKQNPKRALDYPNRGTCAFLHKLMPSPPHEKHNGQVHEAVGAPAWQGTHFVHRRSHADCLPLFGTQRAQPPPEPLPSTGRKRISSAKDGGQDT